MRKAIRERWPIQPHQRQIAIDGVIKLMQDEDPKIQNSAIRTLTMMDSLNIKDDENKIRAMPKHVILHKDLTDEELMAEIAEKAAAFGIEVPKELVQERIDSGEI